MPFQKEGLKEVKEQPGSKQKKLDKDKEPKEGGKAEKKQPPKDKKENKSKGSEKKQEHHDDGMSHPSCSYDTYKRNCK